MRFTVAHCLRSLSALAIGMLAIDPAARSAEPVKRGILVLDDCDPDFRGKESYSDNLTLIDSTAGAVSFRFTGLNVCQAIGSNHPVAADPKRGWIWVVESVGKRIRKVDRSGKELLAIPEIHGNALAVDPETGNVWVLTSKGTIDGDQTLVFDPDGKPVATHDFSGWDIAYDRKSKAFWIAGKTLAKVSADKGKVLFSDTIAVWCSSCIAIHPTTGQVWVAVRKHDQVAGSENSLLRFDNDGKQEQEIPLEREIPFHVSVSEKSGSAWLTILRRGVRRYSAEGKLEREYEAEALATEPDPESGDAWIATSDDILRVSPEGKVLKQILHKAKSSQVWMTGF